MRVALAFLTVFLLLPTAAAQLEDPEITVTARDVVLEPGEESKVQVTWRLTCPDTGRPVHATELRLAYTTPPGLAMHDQTYHRTVPTSCGQAYGSTFAAIWAFDDAVAGTYPVVATVSLPEEDIEGNTTFHVDVPRTGGLSYRMLAAMQQDGWRTYVVELRNDANGPVSVGLELAGPERGAAQLPGAVPLEPAGRNGDRQEITIQLRQTFCGTASLVLDPSLPAASDPLPMEILELAPIVETCRPERQMGNLVAPAFVGSLLAAFVVRLFA